MLDPLYGTNNNVHSINETDHKKGLSMEPYKILTKNYASKISSLSLGLGISKSNPCDARILSSNS